MDGSTPMDVSSLKGIKISDTESRLDALKESLTSGEPIETQKNFPVPSDFETALENGRSEALKFLNSEESIRTDLLGQDAIFGQSITKAQNSGSNIVNKFWKIKDTTNAAEDQVTKKAEEKGIKDHMSNEEEEEEYFDEDLLEEEGYEFAEEKIHFMEEEDLNNAIAEITGKLKLYPEIDHIDYLKYLNNTEGIIRRDVLMYFRGVQKNNVCSMAHKSLELISKLESVVAMSLKNSSHTATNLKLSGEQLAKISQVKSDVLDRQISTVKEEPSKIAAPFPKKKLPHPKSANHISHEIKREEAQWKPKTSLADGKVSQENGLKIFRNVENPSNSILVQEVSKDLNVKIVETPELRESRVKSFSRTLGISDRIIENPKAWTVLFSTITDQVICASENKDEEYRGKMRKAILGKISKAIQLV